MPSGVRFATSVAALDVEIEPQADSLLINLKGELVGEHYISIEAVLQQRCLLAIY